MHRRYFLKQSVRISVLSGIASSSIIPVACGTGWNNPDYITLMNRAAMQGMKDFPEMDFDWGEGVMLEGMAYAYNLTRNPEYLDYLKEFGDRWYSQGIQETLNSSHGNLHGYCGHWSCGYAMQMLFELTQDQKYLELAEEVIRFIEREALRTSEGALSHAFELPGLWVDTLYMVCPLFTNYYRLMGQKKYQEEAVRQLLIFSSHLQDKNSGLFYHVWWEKDNSHTKAFWARGNAWVAMSIVEVLEHEEKGSEAFRNLSDIYTRQIGGIIPLINEQAGLFHTVLDANDSYLETSATAMIASSMIRARDLGILGREAEQCIRMAGRGLAGQLDAKGSVTGVSYGTGPDSDYHQVQLGTKTWGTGAYLRAMHDYVSLVGNPKPKN